MQLNTRHFGLIEIDENKIIDFPEGIPGFQDIKKFVILSSDDKGSPFQWLQAVDNPDLAFVVIDPRFFRPEYVVDVNDAEIEILNIQDPTNVLIYAIVVVPEDISKMTANLKAPVLINTENNRGKQIVMDKDDYKVKHYIMEELKKSGGEG
ncbi:MAG: flagellar assembly factor FliW [Clostridiales bacterium]|jgi:flagellar assembly factor FliW|nr:flagellar assembly factor FliW [Clostridiales bacterium]